MTYVESTVVPHEPPTIPSSTKTAQGEDSQRPDSGVRHPVRANADSHEEDAHAKHVRHRLHGQRSTIKELLLRTNRSRIRMIGAEEKVEAVLTRTIVKVVPDVARDAIVQILHHACLGSEELRVQEIWVHMNLEEITHKRFEFTFVTT